MTLVDYTGGLTMLSVETMAPDFSLPDQTGVNRSLSAFRGKWVVLYFYPKDMTPGCTTEACSFRDSIDDPNLQVIGVSTDSVDSHTKFAGRYNLPFPLLSDTDKTVVRLYQAYGKKKFMGKEFDGTLRVSYLIDPAGKIVKVYPKVNPLTHSQEVLRDYHQCLES